MRCFYSGLFLPKNEALWVVVHEETNEKKGEK